MLINLVLGREKTEKLKINWPATYHWEVTSTQLDKTLISSCSISRPEDLQAY
jgi:hypothetical protein